MLFVSLKTLECNNEFIKKEVFENKCGLVVLRGFFVKKANLEGWPEVTGKEAKPYTVT